MIGEREPIELDVTKVVDKVFGDAGFTEIVPWRFYSVFGGGEHLVNGQVSAAPKNKLTTWESVRQNVVLGTQIRGQQGIRGRHHNRQSLSNSSLTKRTQSAVISA